VAQRILRPAERGHNGPVRELRPVPPPPERRPTDARLPSSIHSERLTPADRPTPADRQTDAAKSLSMAARETRGKASAPDIPEGSREALNHFDPRRAGLPDTQRNDAPRYIEANRHDRPWLDSARDAPKDVQHVFAAADQGGGHAHIRHEGWLSPEKSQLRVQYLQDPAQLDPTKREQGKDGLIPGNKQHYCAELSTCIRDPIAFATAYTRGIEHPDVRTALETPYTPGKPKPNDVALPITHLLGPDGHRYCEGYRLAGDDMDIARQERRTWLKETRAGDRPSVAPPFVVPVDFRGGTVQFRFNVNVTRSGYEIATMFPNPPDRKPDSQ
jgi:hypothetical protein